MFRYPSIPNVNPTSCLLNQDVYVSEKLHGANVCFYRSKGTWRICSRNYVLPEDTTNVFFQGSAHRILELVIKPNFNDFSKPDDVYIYGEMYGPGIHRNVDWYQAPNGWPPELKKFYQIFDIKLNDRFLTPTEFNETASQFENLFVKKELISIGSSYEPLISHINQLVDRVLISLDSHDSLYNLNIKLYGDIKVHEGVIFDTPNGKMKMVFPPFKESKGCKVDLAPRQHMKLQPRTIIDLITPMRIEKRLADLGGEKNFERLKQAVMDDIQEELRNDGRYIMTHVDVMIAKNRDIQKACDELIRKTIEE